MNIELYIEKKLCDIENPDKFSIFLKRQFINPAELNFKDAQKSYSISLPATANNNAIFGFTNTEEVAGKFVKIYDALLIVDGIKILDGKFRLSEISKNYYSGNLGVPKQQTIKEIFGDLNMNQSKKPWKEEFGAFLEWANHYNGLSNPPFFFPYVLYGLLPKRLNEKNEYTPKLQWDDTVALTIDDFPPSLNCLEALKHIFEGEGLRLSGTAFNDERLSRLYMSYKNPSDYQMPWNYGKLGAMKMEVSWANYKDVKNAMLQTDITVDKLTLRNNNVKVRYGSKPAVYTTDLLNSMNGSVTILGDEGMNIAEYKASKYGKDYDSHSIVVPHSGLYKVHLHATVNLNMSDLFKGQQKHEKSDGLDLRVISPHFSDNAKATLADTMIEIKLIRTNRGGNVYDWAKSDIDRDFYHGNIDQDTDMNADNDVSFPKYFPAPGQMCFIDPAQNPGIVCGLSFGKNKNRLNPYTNYLKSKGADVSSVEYCNPIAIKGGLSYTNEGDIIPAAAYSDGYIKCYLEYDENDKSEIMYMQNDKLRVRLHDTQNNPKRSTATVRPNEHYSNLITEGTGDVYQVIWLEKGERLTIIDCCYQTVNSVNTGRHGALMHDVTAKLEIEAFKPNEEWILNNIDATGTTLSDKSMNWDENKDFDTNELNLTGFLPSDVKVDAWIDNFCKAFNLNLIQTDENKFELNVKKAKKSYTRSIIDLDTKTNVDKARKNTPLNLPSVYEIGFTTDNDEEGYQKTQKDGGGRLETGNTEGTPLNQVSSFSYNWFKTIDYKGVDIDFPVITKSEIWNDNLKDYAEMMQKSYTGLAQRFWYKGDNFDVWELGNRRWPLMASLVTNSLDNRMSLDYYNQSKSILDCYFTTFVNNRTNYTMVECYLTPAEYERLPYSPVRFNGDLYYAAEIDGYDPLGRRMCTLKLLRHLL